MYLSRLTLNPRNAQVRAELAHPYQMHRTLSRAFPPDTFHRARSADDTAGLLFRVDETPRDNIITVLVQSQIAPDWTYLNDARDARGHTYLLRPPESKPFDVKFVAGQRLAFRLRANPTKRLGKSAGERQGNRVGIYDEKEQLAWLQRKAEQGGFRLIRVIVSRAEYIENRQAIQREHQTHDLKLFAVQFDGILQVVDPERLRATLGQGIGSGKAFGFGLLSLAPA